jgi:hypothetical protein
MRGKIDLEVICKKAGVFTCIKHKKHAVLTIEAGIIKVTGCCEKFTDHIENFIERQIELAGVHNNDVPG